MIDYDITEFNEPFLLESQSFSPDITEFNSPYQNINQTPDSINLTGLDLSSDYKMSDTEIKAVTSSSSSLTSSLPGYLNTVANLIPTLAKTVGTFFTSNSGKSNSYSPGQTQNGVSRGTSLGGALSSLLPGVQSSNYTTIILIVAGAIILFFVLMKR